MNIKIIDSVCSQVEPSQKNSSSICKLKWQSQLIFSRTTRKAHEKMKLLVLVLLLGVPAASLCRELSFDSPSWWYLETKLNEKTFTRPPWRETGNTTTVTVRLLFSQVDIVTNLEATFTLYLFQWWFDPRLDVGQQTKGEFLSITADQWDKVWTPDTYIENDLNSKLRDTTTTNKFMRVYPNGYVVHSLRFTTQFSCAFGLWRFPVGSYACTIRLLSYAHNDGVLQYVWDKDDSISFNSDFSHSNMEVKRIIITENCLNQNIPGGNKSCLEATVYLHKDYSGNLLQIYLPSVFVVFLGWVSLWIDREQVSARTSIGTLCVVSMITEKVGVNFLLPVLVSFGAIEVWFSVCLSFVTSALFIFAVVHRMSYMRKKRKKERQMKEQSSHDDIKIRVENAIENSHQAEHPDDVKIPSKYKLAEQNVKYTTQQSIKEKLSGLTPGKVEKMARILYPVAFIVFNIIYWIFFLLWQNDDFDL